MQNTEKTNTESKQQTNSNSFPFDKFQEMARDDGKFLQQQ